jgi:hypothetical protein
MLFSLLSNVADAFPLFDQEVSGTIRRSALLMFLAALLVAADIRRDSTAEQNNTASFHIPYTSLFIAPLYITSTV